MDIKQVNYNLSLHIDELLESLGSSTDEFQSGVNSIRGPAICHGGDNPTGFSIYKDPPIWYCWTNGCHELHGRDLVGLIASHFKMSRTEAKDKSLKFLQNKSIKRHKVTKTKVISIEKQHEKQCKFEKSILKRLSTNLSYGTKRGFSASVLKKMGCGLGKSGPMKDRLVFPIKDIDGEVVGFTGRTTVEDKIKWRHTKFKKSINLLSLDICNEFIKKQCINKIIIVEGPWDLAKLCQAGFWNSMAILGSGISKGQVEMIKQLGVTSVVLLMDNDDGGHNNELVNSVKLQRGSLDVKVVYPPNKNEDVGDMKVKGIKDLLKDIQW